LDPYLSVDGFSSLPGDFYKLANNEILITGGSAEFSSFWILRSTARYIRLWASINEDEDMYPVYGDYFEVNLDFEVAKTEVYSIDGEILTKI